MSGRLLGVRADITPQVARIDAHLLNEPGVTRLCYAGSVLRTTAGIGETREVAQIGAELFGEAGIAGDTEVIMLLLSSLAAAGMRRAASRPRARRRLSRARSRRGHRQRQRGLRALRRVARKGRPDRGRADGEAAAGVARRARRAAFALRPGDARCSPPRARDCRTLRRSATRSPRSPTLADAAAPRVEALHIDLADLRGYHYHSGAIFSVFTAGPVCGDRQWRPLRRHRQGVRARAACNRIHARIFGSSRASPARSTTRLLNRAARVPDPPPLLRQRAHGQERRRHRNPVGR